MTKQEVVKRLKRFTIKDLELMQKDKIVTFPITEHEFALLVFIHNFWAKKKWLKRQLIRMSLENRKKLIYTCKLDKIETYIYSRLAKNPQDKRLPTSQIIREVAFYFKLPLSKAMFIKMERTIRRIKRMLKRNKISASCNRE